MTTLKPLVNDKDHITRSKSYLTLWALQGADYLSPRARLSW